MILTIDGLFDKIQTKSIEQIKLIEFSPSVDKSNNIRSPSPSRGGWILSVAKKTGEAAPRKNNLHANGEKSQMRFVRPSLDIMHALCYNMRIILIFKRFYGNEALQHGG